MINPAVRSPDDRPLHQSGFGVKSVPRGAQFTRMTEPRGRISNATAPGRSPIHRATGCVYSANIEAPPFASSESGARPGILKLTSSTALAFVPKVSPAVSSSSS